MGALDAFSDLEEYYPGSRHKIQKKTPTESREEDLLKWDRDPIQVTIGGVPQEMFSLGRLSEALRRKPVTLRKWEADRTMPKATYWKKGRDGDHRGNRRLYTRAQVEGLIKIAEEEGLMKDDRRSIKSTRFTQRSFELFRKLAAQ